MDLFINGTSTNFIKEFFIICEIDFVILCGFIGFHERFDKFVANID